MEKIVAAGPSVSILFVLFVREKKVSNCIRDIFVFLFFSNYVF